MDIKVLNFYLPQTSAYFIGPIAIFFLLVSVIIGILSLILLILFRKKNEIKSRIMWMHFVVVFIIQIFSIYICYTIFNTGTRHFNLISTITFFIAFGILFLIYYIPFFGTFLIDFLITKILMIEKEAKNK